MSNRRRNLSRQLHSNPERGQALVLIALAFIGLAAFIGLTVDAGILFSNIGHLRRATDAASLAAANQFREGRDPDELSKMATDVLELNGLTPFGVVVAKVCDLGLQGPPFGPGSAWDDPSLCSTGGESPRKFVRVEAQLQVNFAFLPIIGWGSTIIQANSISEAASVDLVLVLDVSPSMSYNLCNDDIDNDVDGLQDECPVLNLTDDFGADATGGNSIPESDVKACVANRKLRPPYSEPAPVDRPWIDGDLEDDCHPFEEVREAAHLLVDRMYFPYDRIGIVTFATLATINLELDPNDPPVPCGLVNTSSPVSLKVCADTVIDSLNPELEADPAVACPNWGAQGDPRGCMSTNTGGGTKAAAGMYCRDAVDYGGNGDGNCDRNEMREEAVWIAIMLSDGIANAANSADPPSVPGDWICPISTWGAPSGGGPPYCSDGDPNPPPSGTRHPSGDVDYDADDYARDWADFLGCPSPPNVTCANTVPGGGQDVVIFSIGLGEAVTKYTKGGDVDQGEQLLRYIAAVGDDGDPLTDPCASALIGKDCGNYYFVLDPSGGQLLDVFEAIASRIFTRITH
jgi:hypothetical protein